MRIILASSSPRRRELLESEGYQFVVMPPDASVECGVCSENGPAELVFKLALRKGHEVAQRLRASGRLPTADPVLPGDVLVAADTVAECDGQILGKPVNEEHARGMLAKMSGRPHRVYTGVCVWHFPFAEDAADVRCAITELRMDELSPDELQEYLDSGQWEGKAGAFGYQDRLGWVHITEGSESNVVGLPLELLAEMLG